MEINGNTRISDLIKENKDSIHAIASLAKPLEKLKNPLLRKLMASRVTIAEAAKMGGCTLADFERVLIPMGFTFIDSDLKEGSTDDKVPIWLKILPETSIERYDVREILAGGKDPLKQIMARFKAVPIGSALCIINTFEPVPLVRLLEREGVLSFTKTIRTNEYHTFFYKVSITKSSPEPIEKAVTLQSTEKVRMLDERSFQDIYDRFTPSKIRVIDVRHLEMPGPMQTILEIIPDLADDEALYVNHKRIPLYLLEEIADEDYCVNIFTLAETDVKLLIHKAK